MKVKIYKSFNKYHDDEPSNFSKCLSYEGEPTFTLCKPPTAYIIQDNYCDSFSDSDWDVYDNKNYEFNHIKSKIAFALFGPPSTCNSLFLSDKNSAPDVLTGYNAEQVTHVEKIFAKVLFFGKYSAGGDRIYMKIFYACCVPLMKNTSKSSNLDCYKHIESHKILVLPVFRLRKCIRQNNHDVPPCCSYVDDHGRVYKNWDDYLKNNKLPEGVLVVPENGKYTRSFGVEGVSRVLLQTVMSPASSKLKKALNICNKVGMGVGLASAGVFVSAVFLPIAAPVMITAGVGGLATGVFATGMSSSTLADRSKHGQTLSPTDPEARGCWLNIGASSLGIASGISGQILAYSVGRGIAIGQIARGAHNGLIVASTFTNGLGVANGVYVIVDRYKTHGETPSPLEWLQMSSSLLFFCHSIVNIRMASQIIEETQFSTLEYQRSALRSNRHRKIFDKLAAETRRQHGDTMKGNTEIIRSMRMIEDKDAFFAGALRLNKQLNQNNIKISFDSRGEALLNGQHSVKPDILITLSTAERDNLFSNIGPSKLVAKNSPTKITFMSTSSGIPQSFNLSLNSIIKIVQVCSSESKLKNLIKNVIYDLTNDAFEKLYDLVQGVISSLLPIDFEKLAAIGIPNDDKIYTILKFTFDYLKKNKFVNETVADFIDRVFIASNLRREIISAVVDELCKYVKTQFDQKHYTEIQCTICHGARFAK